MVRTELYIDGANGTDGFLSFPFGVNIPVSLNFNLADVRNPEQRKASFSKTINLLGTNEVNKLFENLFEVNVVTQYFNKNLKTPVKYLVDGLENFAGDLQLIKVNINPDNSIVYECSIIGAGGSLFVDIGEKYITGNQIVEQNKGLLIIGRKYTIKTFVAGDNFTSVANVVSGTINTTGCVFIAIGTTPTTWTNQSILTSSDDLDFSAYDHNYTRVNQIASRTNVGTGLSYAYPFIDRGTNGGSDTVWNVKDFLPTFSVYEYVKKIIEATGRTFTSTFLNSSFFKHLYCYSNVTKSELTQAQLDDMQWYVGLTADVTIPYSRQDVVYNDETTFPFFDGGSQYSTAITTIAQPGFYNIVGKVAWKFKIQHINPSVAFIYLPVALQTGGAYKNIRVKESIDGGTTYYNLINQVSQLGLPTTPMTFTGLGTRSYYKINVNTFYTEILEAVTGEQFLNTANKIKVDQYLQTVQTVYSGTATNAGVTICTDASNNIINSSYSDLTITTQLLSGATGSSFYGLVTKKEIFEGGSISVNTVLPTKIKQKEFLTSILRAFNLFVEVNPNDANNLLIEPFDEFYNTTDIVNYENRTDLSKEQTINPNLLEGKRYIYTYKADKDYYNDLYFNTHNEVFGTEQIDVENDFIKSDKKTELIFSATPLAANYELGIAMPKIYTKDGTNIKTIAANIRLLYLETKTSPNAYTYKQQGEADLVTNEYLHAGMEDDALNPTVSLMFGPAKEFYYNYINAYFTTNTLYNKYHKQYLVNLIDRDAKFVTKYLWLTPKDINQFSFRNRLFIDGSYYIVNKIENYTPLEQTSTKVELIKLLDTEVFVPESILISDSSVDAGSEVYTARLNSSLNVGTNIQNRGTNCLAIGENIVIPESCNNLIVFGSNITADENSTGLLLNYKSYVALITQSGTAAPTVTILENTIGDISWTRSSVGQYVGLLTDAFTLDKVVCFNNNIIGNFIIKRSGIDSLVIYTNSFAGTPTDSLLVNTSIEIRVYN